METKGPPMLRELLSILRPGKPVTPLGESFARMVEIASDLTLRAGKIYFGEQSDPQELPEIRRQDLKVNKLQRKIRKGVVTHLSELSNSHDLPYCLQLFSLVKDVERIGDYAKELSSLRELGTSPLPDHEAARELMLIRMGVDMLMADTQRVLRAYDGQQAVKMIRHGRGLIERANELLRSLAADSFDAATHAALILGTQYYKRLCGHVLNVLSSIVVPLHRLDYYDEDDLAVARNEKAAELRKSRAEKRSPAPGRIHPKPL
jgi:phosphate uptake regulator